MATIEKEVPDYGCCPDDESQYPYSTRMEFEGSTAEELGVDTLKAGEMVKVTGLAFVREASQEAKEAGGEVKKELCLQMTEVFVSAVAPDRVNLLYPDE